MELIMTVIIIWVYYDVNIKIQLYDSAIKRKQPCVSGIELVSLTCNRVFVSTEAIGQGWCKITIATKWCQFHASQKCGFLCHESLTNTHLDNNTELINMRNNVVKVLIFQIITIHCDIHSVGYSIPPHPEQNVCTRIHVQCWKTSLRTEHAPGLHSKQVVYGHVMRYANGGFILKFGLSY